MNIKKLNSLIQKLTEDVSSSYISNLNKIEKSANEKLLPKIKELEQKIRKQPGLNKPNFSRASIKMLDSLMLISNLIFVEVFGREVIDHEANTHYKKLKEERVAQVKKLINNWINSLYLDDVNIEIYDDSESIMVEFSGNGLYR